MFSVGKNEDFNRKSSLNEMVLLEQTIGHAPLAKSDSFTGNVCNFCTLTTISRFLLSGYLPSKTTFGLEDDIFMSVFGIHLAANVWWLLIHKIRHVFAENAYALLLMDDITLMFARSGFSHTKRLLKKCYI